MYNLSKIILKYMDETTEQNRTEILLHLNYYSFS